MAMIFWGGMQLHGQCTENIYLFTQEEVDAFPQNYGCSEIGKSLIIGDYYEPFEVSNISNLDSLNSIEIINGDLIVQYTSVENFEGLGSLTSVGGDVFIQENNNLINFLGLEGLSYFEKEVGVFSNASLVNFEGLENVERMESEVIIAFNPSLENLEGLENLEQTGSLSIWGNDNLLSLEGLLSLININGSLLFDENASLINLTGLENLENVFSSVYIWDNINLVNFEGLENLDSIGALRVFGNTNLENFEGLENLVNIRNILDVENNTILSNFEGLQNLKSIGSLQISNNANLPNFVGLESLHTIEGIMDIDNNPSLSSFTGLENLFNVLGDYIGGSYIRIIQNEQLSDCCLALNWLNNFEGEITIEGNAASCNSLDTILTHCIDELYSIQTQVFYDQNGNSLLDNTEPILIQDYIMEPSVAFAFSDEAGVAFFYLTEFGTYTITLKENNPLWICNNECDTIEFTYSEATLMQDTLILFPMQAVGDYIIQAIDLTSSITRCNQETNYWITYSNTGTITTNGYVQLIPDSLSTFVSAEPAVDSIAGDTLYWFYNDLYPTYSNQIKTVFEMPNVDFLGENIHFEAYIETNEGYAGRKDILNSELVCAYDPNDKLVTPYGYGTDNYTLFGDTLEYTVRFQNTGNDTAFYVEIRDEISEHLDLKSFDLFAYSHNVETQIDIESRVATFRFNDIYLPDSFVNESASHGFVKYRILAKAGLEENTDVQNTAYIYFDENPPIVTNTVSNRMVSVLPQLPIIGASPNTLDFGEIALDKSWYIPQDLLIQNLGDLDLIVDEFVFTSEAFSSGEIETVTVAGQSVLEVPIYFAPNEAGTYTSELLLKSNGGDLVIPLSGTAVEGTGINTLAQNNLYIYPNPTEGQLYVEAKNGNIQNIQIHNSQGNLVLEQKMTTSNQILNLSKWGSGLYFLQVQTDEGMAVHKIIIR